MKVLFACAPLLLLLATAATVPAAQPPRPNFIVVLVDDLGRHDLGCYGSKFHQTPHLDRLAAQGMRFTQAYSACTVCSPTRAALLTGKSPARLHVTDWIEGHKRPQAKLKVPDWTMHLPSGERTVAAALKAAGYATASIGKWHLGGPAFAPEKFGFDTNLGGTSKGQPPSYFSPYKIATLPDGPAGEHLTDREATEAVKFIEANRERPFFLYLPHHAVHTPLQAKKEVVEKYRARAKSGGQTNAVYAALLEGVDESIGRITAKLDELKLADRTVILFTGDNGGLIGPTSNAPLRAGKGSVYEGGVAVPLIIRWPGQIAAGGVNATPVTTVDFAPTLLELAGVASAAGQAFDGASLAPLLKGGALEPRPLFWHYPHYHPGGATPYGAIRDGDFRLIEFYETGRLELFDLKADPRESRNLAVDQPEKALALQRKLDAWRRSGGAQMPLPNPEYRPNPQAADGRILLHSRAADVQGAQLRYEPEPHKNTLGYWTRREDSASWDFTVTKPGAFMLEALQGCGKGSGGAEVEFAIGEQRLAMTVQDTGHFQNFVPRDIGMVQIGKAGIHTLTVRAKTKPGVAVMDLRQVTLRPTK
jgi:arylsulfatase A-like enzyme